MPKYYIPMGCACHYMYIHRVYISIQISYISMLNVLYLISTKIQLRKNKKYQDIEFINSNARLHDLTGTYFLMQCARLASVHVVDFFHAIQE